MIQEPQRVALPAVLRQGLVAFRDVHGDRQQYRIRDNWKGVTYEFEAWQYFVLEVLPVCGDFEKLASIFEDRFGRSLAKSEAEALFALTSEKKLFGVSAESHPLLEPFVKKREAAVAGRAPAASPQSMPAAPRESGKGNGNGGDGSHGPAPAATAPGTGRDDISFNTADFSADDFQRQNKKIDRLCTAIKNDGLAPGAIKAPENTIEWLNNLLQTPDLIDLASSRKQDFRPTDDIRKLKSQTEKSRKEAFKSLKPGEQNTIRMMNRLLLELLYPDAPKMKAPEDPDADKRLSWNMFNPSAFLKLAHPFLEPLKYAVYLLPVPLLAALFTALNNAELIRADFSRINSGLSFASHVFIGMFTVNLFATLVTAFTAFSYGASVHSFGVVLHFGFLPRFTVRTGTVRQLTQRERIWFYAAPLLARASVLAAGVLVWFGARSMDGAVPQLALTAAFIAGVSLLLSANPLMKSSGSNLLGAFMNEPQLRAKAFMALANKLKGNLYRKADSGVLAAYALACAVFLLAVMSAFVALFGGYLKLHLGGAGVFLIVIVMLLLLVRLVERIRLVGAAYDRAVQYDRWKNRALPTAETVRPGTEAGAKRISTAHMLIGGAVFAALLVPYHYEPGGRFVLLPNQKYELTSENSAIIAKVHFDGGEFIRKGTIIAELSTADYRGQMNIYDAKVREQQAILNDLRSRPKPEELQLARQALDVQEQRARFSGEKLRRLETLYREKTVSFEEFEDQRREHEVNLAQVREYRAKLELVEAGATDEEIAAAEARMQSYIEERDFYGEKINQSMISMPFDGRLEGVNLRQKVGHYLNKGELFAVAQNTTQVFAEIEVPEPDIAYVASNSNIRVRPLTYSDSEFRGVVKAIDAGVSEKASGRVVKVVTLLDNKDEVLKSGMTGYAKISSENMAIGKVLTRAVIRFFEVEVWSWLP